MSLEHSRKLIHEIAATREADDYVEGLLKDPEMRADMELANSKWDALVKDIGIIAVEPTQQEMERER